MGSLASVLGSGFVDSGVSVYTRSASSGAPKVPQQGWQRSRVYLVEDDEDISFALQFMLNANGFDVTTFQTGQALLQHIRHGQQFSVLMDLRLPDVSGLDLLVRIKALMPSVPVVVMTGFGQVQMAVRAMKLGALDFLEKPIDEALLVELLKRAHTLSVPTPAEASSALLAELTAREIETLSKLALGLTSKQAAQQLGISPRTVDVHRAAILQKMGAATTALALASLRQIEPRQYHLLTENPQALLSQVERCKRR